MSELFKNNRKRFAKELDKNSLYIVFAGKAGQSSGDQYYPFAPKRNLYYLTGIDRPGVIFTIYKSSDGEIKETMYLERYDETEAKWVGAVLGKEEAANRSGIENFSEVDNFENDVARFLFAYDKIKVCMDMENRSFGPNVSSEIRFANKIRKSFPHVPIENIRSKFAKLRSIKSKEEIENIRKAIEITKDAFYLMMSHSAPGLFEYEYEAYFDYYLKKNGISEYAFESIVATGKNAAILHYSDKNTAAKDGDLILFDIGASWNHYSADITRTIPVNGKFTARQKELYNIVLEANLKVISKIGPGLAFKELNEIVINHYEEELVRIGLIKDKSEIRNYYYHGVSHLLGLDTHDVSRGRDFELKKGMILTVEPGLYLANEGIGIRIEDDVLVTRDGCEVLSQDILRTVEEIESYMSERRPAGHCAE